MRRQVSCPVWVKIGHLRWVSRSDVLIRHQGIGAAALGRSKRLRVIEQAFAGNARRQRDRHRTEDAQG
jgi:hypothetical protein